MASGEYQVVFHGELTGEHPEETVRQRLADLFGMPTRRIDALFAGKPVVVKKNVDRSTADRFEQTFRRAGARCEIRGPAETEPAGERSGDAAPADGRDSGETAPAGAAAGDRGRRTAGGSIAAAGDPNGTVVALDVPTSFDGLAIDDTDQPLSAGERPAPPSIDTGGLSLADDEAGPPAPGPRAQPADIDTSGLSLESLDEASPGNPGGT